MIWKDHSKDPHMGEHALLSPSKKYWVDYDDSKIKALYDAERARYMGDRLHAFACECISLGQKLPKSTKTLNMYVNDAIGYGMQPEQELYYSRFCYGKADAIIQKGKLLRIHDLKTGVTPASLVQLEIYAALYCLDYGVDPNSIEYELRIYQNDDVLIGRPDVNVIMDRINAIIHGDKILSNYIQGEQ